MRREKAAQKRKATKTAAEVIPVDNTENLVPPQVASYASRRKREYKEKQKLKKGLKALGHRNEMNKGTWYRMSVHDVERGWSAHGKKKFKDSLVSERRKSLRTVAHPN